MFAITLVAVAAAVAAWLRPTPEAKSAAPSTPTFSAQQVAGAKSKVCDSSRKFTAQLMSMHREAAVATRRLNLPLPRI
jgi:hypothetical protein